MRAIRGTSIPPPSSPPDRRPRQDPRGEAPPKSGRDGSGGEELGSAALRRAEWTPAGLWAKLPGATPPEVSPGYRLRVPHHYLGLIQSPDDPLWRQAVPSRAEGGEPELPQDPLAEDDPAYSPVPHLTHRYPDRVLLLVTDLCPLFCRFCMRKRKTLAGAEITSATVAAARSPFSPGISLNP